MFARWNRMAKQFARIAKDITMAVKAGGADPAGNPTLRRVIQNARAVNMPKDKIEAAIKRATGRDAAHYQEVHYEAYAPHGVALLVEAATDNPTRTVAAVRNIVTKGGGNLATSGSVAFLFKHLGVFRLDPSGIDQDDLELYLIDHGLEEMGESRSDERPGELRSSERPAPEGRAGSDVQGETSTMSGPGSPHAGTPPGTVSGTAPHGEQMQLVIRCAFADFGRLQEALEARSLAPLSAEHEYICIAPAELPEEQAQDVLSLVDKLEQDEDVQRVFHTLA